MSSSRQSSISSTTGPSSPFIDTQHSPELVHVNDADFPNAELDFSSDDELPDDFAAQTDRFNASIIPPLSPTLVLLYLSIPYLKLGPMFLPTSDTPLSQSIPTLLICAAFAAFTRELWYLLARYLRKMDIEEVVLDVFAQGSDKTRTRLRLRVIVRVGTFVMRVHALLPLVPTHSVPLARGLLTASIALVLLPLCGARSLAAKRIIYATSASFLAYLTWLGVVTYAHVKGTLSTDLHWERPGVLWQGIS